MKGIMVPEPTEAFTADPVEVSFDLADWVIRPGHFAERHGLITIIALGQVIVAGLALAAVAALAGDVDGVVLLVLVDLVILVTLVVEHRRIEY